ncbi:integrase core domain-containing protein [Nocardia fluminea]|uniref:integrase core domain-containing protein n=1 Tax=Nocardia fluminea TaxID=134984 RepID=UPI00366D1BA6
MKRSLIIHGETSCRAGRGEGQDRVVGPAFITAHPELRHARTRVRSPGKNGSRERSFGSLKYERLLLEEIDDVLALVDHAEVHRVEYNAVRPHEAIAWNRLPRSTEASPTR